MDGRRLSVTKRSAIAGFLLCLLAPGPAHAGAVEDLLDATLQALLAKEYDEVAKYTKRAEKVADSSDTVIPATTLANIWYYAGLAEWYGGDRDTRALEQWRLALASYEEHPWDATNFVDDEAETVFESLRREVKSRKHVDLAIPEEHGKAKIFVSGRPVQMGDEVVDGNRYLIQVVCPPDGTVYSRWWKYGKAPKYEELCPEGFGVVEEAPPAEEAGDVAEMFDDFGNPIGAARSRSVLEANPSLDEPGGEKGSTGDVVSSASSGDPATTAAAEPPKERRSRKGKEEKVSSEDATRASGATGEPPVVAASSTPVEPTSTPTTPATTGTVESDPVVAGNHPGGGEGPDQPGEGRRGPHVLPSSTTGRGVSGAGVGLVAVGSVLNFVWVNPIWADIQAARDNPAGITAEEAAGLTSRFNTARVSTLACMGVGFVALGTGYLVSWEGVGLTPQGVFVSGRF